MTILHLITKSEAGGAQTHVAQLCAQFQKKHDIVVVAAPGGWLEAQCKTLGVRFFPNPYFSNSANPVRLVRSILHIRRIVTDVAPDIVHCHSFMAGFVGRLAVRKKIPTIYTAHGWGFNIGVGFIQKWASIMAERLVSGYTTKILCVSHFVRDLALRYHIAPAEKLEVIYNGVESQEAQYIPHDSISIVFVGRLTAPKRPLVLLEALSCLSQELRDRVQVDIVGEGIQREALETHISTHALPRVRLRGALPRAEIFGMLKTADVFVLLSDWEGFPMTILEAMSVGLPILASDVGGIREMVDESNGCLISSPTPQNVADALLSLLTDDARRRQMGAASLSKARTQFSLEQMYREIDRVYSAVV